MNYQTFATDCLRQLDPGGLDFWSVIASETKVLPSENTPIDRLSVVFSFLLPPRSAPPPKSEAFRMTKVIIPTAPYEPHLRWWNACHGFGFRLQGASPFLSTGRRPEDLVDLVAGNQPSAPEPGDSGNFVWTPPSWISRATWNDNALGMPPFPDSPIDFVSIRFRFQLDVTLIRQIVPFPPRKPRKWGRVLTPKWESEHAQIVAQRKFKRNTKKAKEGKLDRFEGYPTLKAQCDAKQVNAHLQTRAALLKRMDSLINRTKSGARRATLRTARRALAKLVKGVKRIKRKT